MDDHYKRFNICKMIHKINKTQTTCAHFLNGPNLPLILYNTNNVPHHIKAHLSFTLWLIFCILQHLVKDHEQPLVFPDRNSSSRSGFVLPVQQRQIHSHSNQVKSEEALHILYRH